MPVPSLAKAALLAATLAAAPIAAPAQPAPANPGKPHDQCFLRSDIDGFNAPDDHTLYIEVGVREVYRLDLMGPCPGLSFKNGIGLKSTPGFPWVCSPLDATVVFHDAGVPQECPVTAIHHLTPAELAALPKRERP